MTSARNSTATFRSPHRARTFLSSTDLFGNLGPRVVEDVLDRAEWVHLRGGEVLFRQGERGDAMYVVVSGRVAVVLERSDGGAEVVREMGSGENVGELSLLTDDPRSATIRAVRDSELLRLPRDAFDALLESRPATALRLTRILARWVREGNRGRDAPREPATVAVVPASPGADALAFGRRLAASLGKAGSVRLLEAGAVEGALGPESARAPEGSAAYRSATDWLSLQEVEHRFLVYVSEDEPGEWSRRCLRQADAVLVVARAVDRPGLLPVAAEAVATLAGGPPELVLLHSADVTAPVSGRWLEAGRFARHHHVRDGAAGDVDRVARGLTGRSVGLVLGGGGARGFVHVGVIRALREAGVPLDRLGGASMGAIVAALFATGMEADEVERTLQWAWARSDNRPHRRLTFPAYSLVTGEQVRRMLGWVFGDRRIEDLWTPFFCAAANLSRGELMVHRTGPVVRWVEASVAIPGIVPPVVTDEGELLADGALLDSLPTDVMAEERRGPVVAVSASSDTEFRVDDGLTRAPSGWEALAGRLLPFRERSSFPNIFRILHRATVVGSLRPDPDRPGLDLYLEPPVEAFDMFDWTEMGRIVETGYRYTSERLAAEPERVEALVAGLRRDPADRAGGTR